MTGITGKRGVPLRRTARIDERAAKALGVRVGYATRDYVLSMDAEGVSFRRSKSRTWFGPVPWPTVLGKAVEVKAREQAAAKAARRKARRAGR